MPIIYVEKERHLMQMRGGLEKITWDKKKLMRWDDEKIRFKSRKETLDTWS